MITSGCPITLQDAQTDELWQARNILLFTYNRLNNMTTEEFQRGADKPIREKIAKFLQIDEE
jgi:hypothetical protein